MKYSLTYKNLQRGCHRVIFLTSTIKIRIINGTARQMVYLYISLVIIILKITEVLHLMTTFLVIF